MTLGDKIWLLFIVSAGAAGLAILIGSFFWKKEQ